MQAHPDLVEFRLAHDAGQAQQKTIVVGARVVKAFAIRDEHAEHRSEFEQLMPVPIVAGQARSVEADHEPGVAEADLGDQLLETVALDAARTRFAEVLIDNLHALMGPPQTDRAIGQAVCKNRPVRSDQLEQVVWRQVRALLEDPRRVADEYHRRLAQARDGAALPDEIVRLDRQMSGLRRGIGRLIDSFAEGIIDKMEFAPRLAGLKQRLSQLQDRYQAALEAAETERNLALVISHVEEFSAKVAKGLDHLDRFGMRDIIRTVVRRIEIDDSQIEVIFRVPPSATPPGPKSPTQTTGPWQHCTAVR
jgi:hypothetical protein